MQINKELLEAKLVEMLADIRAGSGHSSSICAFEDGKRQIQITVTSDEDDFIDHAATDLIKLSGKHMDNPTTPQPAATVLPTSKLKVIFKGSLRNGFEIHAIVKEDDIEQQVIDLLLGGTLADDLEIKDPMSLDPNTQADPNGSHLVVFSIGIHQGVEVFGPFADPLVAARFGEEHRDATESWEVISLIQAVAREGVPA